jgi:tripartite-type tricarboxylate transporter receptor subunit TctC
MKLRRRHALALALGAAASACSLPALAQGNWPSKPITIVVSYPAGGDTDAMARLFAEKLQSRLGQPVIVDNKPGASGIIGNAYVAKAAPDGYTLLLTPSTFSIATLVVRTTGSNGYDVLHDFTPIVLTATQPLFLVTGATGAKDMKELLASAKANKQLSYASPGSGSPMHILGELFNKATGVKVSHVPYRGVAPAVNDVLGGHVPLTYITWGPVAPYVANGKMHALAVADRERSPLAPEVPTLAELGVRDVEVSAWQALMGPKNMPADVVATLNKHMNEILKMPDVSAKMKVFGAIPAGGDTARVAKVNATDYARYGKIIKDFGIQAD